MRTSARNRDSRNAVNQGRVRTLFSNPMLASANFTPHDKPTEGPASVNTKSRMLQIGISQKSRISASVVSQKSRIHRRVGTRHGASALSAFPFQLRGSQMRPRPSAPLPHGVLHTAPDEEFLPPGGQNDIDVIPEEVATRVGHGRCLLFSTKNAITASAEMMPRVIGAMRLRRE